jgi:hypothetical protein
LCNAWSRKDSRRRQVKFINRSEAEKYFRTEAERLSKLPIQLRSIVLDATIPAIRRHRASSRLSRQLDKIERGKRHRGCRSSDIMNWRIRRWLWRRRGWNLCRARHGESVQ